MPQSSRHEFVIEEGQQGERIDKVLAALMEDASRSFIQKLIADGHVLLGAEPCLSKKEKVACGDVITVTVPEPEVLSAEPEDIPLDIVYEDDDVLVVNKPRGMVVHPAAGNRSGTLVNGIMYHCAGRLSSINGVVRPGIVHRIDKDTSGLLMVAKNDAAHRSLAAQLAEHSTKRAYVALVYNSFTDDEGVIDEPIGRDPVNRLRRAVVDEAHGKRAVTHYYVRERLGRYALIEARLETGRTHQIRVHMSYIGHPLVGDMMDGPSRNPFGIEGQLLHAYLLWFVHPVSGQYMEFRCHPPEIFTRTLEKMRKMK
jgi:23S rRNA pseudouridine1911/1915/1917 synthase